MSSYTPLPPHNLPPEAKQFLETLTPKERALHQLAIEKLGSSYFMEYSHAFSKWKATLNKLPPTK